MERLTYRGERDWEIKGADGTPCDEVCENRFLSGCHDCPIQTAFDRLAAYEDTGLSPETVGDLLERFNFFYRTVEGLDIVDPVHFGAFVDWVKRWQQAEKDGRMVVLPVPVGAGKVAYGLTDSDDGKQSIVTIECDYLEKFEIWDNPGHEVVIEVDGWEIGDTDIGKTVFLTREEAEEALKKREADNEAY